MMVESERFEEIELRVDIREETNIPKNWIQLVNNPNLFEHIYENVEYILYLHSKNTHFYVKCLQKNNKTANMKIIYIKKGDEVSLSHSGYIIRFNYSDNTICWNSPWSKKEECHIYSRFLE
jgi:hypothetical protein